MIVCLAIIAQTAEQKSLYTVHKDHEIMYVYSLPITYCYNRLLLILPMQVPRDDLHCPYEDY